MLIELTWLQLIDAKHATLDAAEKWVEMALYWKAHKDNSQASEDYALRYADTSLAFLRADAGVTDAR